MLARMAPAGSSPGRAECKNRYAQVGSGMRATRDQGEFDERQRTYVTWRTVMVVVVFTVRFWPDRKVGRLMPSLHGIELLGQAAHTHTHTQTHTTTSETTAESSHCRPTFDWS